MSTITAITAAAQVAYAYKKLPEGDKPEEHEDNTYDLPDGRPLRIKLRAWFASQAKRTLGTTPDIGDPLPPEIHGPTDETAMAQAMTPILSMYWDEAGKTTRGRIGLDPDEWRVTDAHTQGVIRDTTFAFCRETNQTTSLQLDEAHAKLREELEQGIVEQGEAIPQLRKRVQAVYDRAGKERAELIARTETSRAVHAASAMSAQDSGVVTGKTWLLSASSCDRCQALAAKVPPEGVPLDDLFGKVGDNPVYSDIRFPPAHVRCRCSISYVISSSYLSQLLEDGPPDHPVTKGAFGISPESIRKTAAFVRAKAKQIKRIKKRYRTIQKYRSLIQEAWPALLETPKLPELEAEQKPLHPMAAMLQAYVSGDVKVALLAQLETTYRDARTHLETVYDEAVEAYQKAQRVADEHSDEVKTAESALQKVVDARKLYETYQDALPDLVSKALGVTEPAKIDGKPRANHPAKTAIVAGQAFVASVLAADAAAPKLVVNYARSRAVADRAYYEEAKRQVWASDHEQAPTIAHELGHAIEHQWKRVGELAQQFLDYRIGDEESIRMADLFPDFGYDRWEKGRKDKFDQAFDEREAYYVGKDYRIGKSLVYSTEILAMGLQKLMTDPVGFARNDPEYCKFVVGILSGELR